MNKHPFSTPPLDVDVILFDLDNTIYPHNAGLWQEIDRRIQQWVSMTLHLPMAEAHVVQHRYWQDYGTTIMGLVAEHGVNPVPYLHYVHDLDLSPFLRPNPQLASVLAALPQRKAIFTNATAAHARNVLNALDVAPFFEQLIGMDELGYVSKPRPQAYERCLALLAVRPQQCLFIEDSAKNLLPARELGMHTALIGSPADGEADYYLQCAEDVAELVRRE
ncbi:MAG: pyrimidine 5'-nucleotidase [Chloroflexi bacterium]|nr:pyrimidine 5'-nucleotidase [Chloroflexota bacterium]